MDFSDDDNTDNNNNNINNDVIGMVIPETPPRTTFAKKGELKACSQCKTKVYEDDMKIGRYPKERFTWNQTYQKKGSKSDSISDYLVCTVCYENPQCIGCACVPDIGHRNAVCCSDVCASINLDNLQTDNVESSRQQQQIKMKNFDRRKWKCEACKTKERHKTKERRKKKNASRSRVVNTPPPQSKMRRTMNTSHVDREEDTITFQTFDWGSLNSMQWSVLWNVCVLKKFDNEYSRTTLEDIVRYLNVLPVGRLSDAVDIVVKAINLLHQNKNYLYKNYHAVGSTFGVKFDDVLRDCGVWHHSIAVCQVNTSRLHYQSVTKIQSRCRTFLAVKKYKDNRYFKTLRQKLKRRREKAKKEAAEKEQLTNSTAGNKRRRSDRQRSSKTSPTTSIRRSRRNINNSTGTRTDSRASQVIKLGLFEQLGTQ